MNKILEFPATMEVNINDIVDEEVRENEECAVKVERTEEVLSSIYEVSDLIKSLPLPTEDNDNLIHKLSGLILRAEHDAFNQGFSFGVEVAKYMEVEEI